MNILEKNINFYYDQKWFVSVKLPIGCKPTIYMVCDTDNRPFPAIINDIKTAIELLNAEHPHGYAREIKMACELPGLLGYRRCSSALM